MKKSQNKLRIGIVGYGVVGRATANAFESKEGAIIYYIDKKDANTNYDAMCNKADYIFICVPTPTTAMGTCNTQIVIDVLKELKERSYEGIVIIKSTCELETTKKARRRFDMKINYNPEFLSEDTAFQDALNPEMTVVGGEEADQIKKELYGDDPLCIVTDSTTAEMIKYFFNCFFLLKVVYANQMFDICEKRGADYSTVLKAAKRHKWIADMHLDVFHKGFRGANGKCLPKDAKVMSWGSDLLKTAVKLNEDYLKLSNRKPPYYED
jgi:UDPglucose 6-dehydrogenase